LTLAIAARPPLRAIRRVSILRLAGLSISGTHFPFRNAYTWEKRPGYRDKQTFFDSAANPTRADRRAPPPGS
jgi:hypothetical protein